jgi:general secretion pathway protein A
MYEQFFGLRERPFDLTPNPRYLVLTEGHREALSNLEYGIASRKGITLLLGEAGAGKTTIIRAAIERQTSRVHCVHVSNPALTRDEFVEMLAMRFELSDHSRRSKTVLLIELEALLRRRYREGETTVLILDEAQSLSTDLLEEVRLLANIETTEDKLLSLIIAGQPELSRQLDHDNLRQLKQRVALRCELRPLTLQETAAYLAGRIRAAGGVPAQIFTREAVARMYECSGGIPRTINVVADNALLAGFARGESQVTGEVVREVTRDFHLGAPGSRAEAAAPSAPPQASTAAKGTSAPPGGLLASADAHAGADGNGATGAPEPGGEIVTPNRKGALFAAVTADRRRPFAFLRGR